MTYLQLQISCRVPLSILKYRINSKQSFWYYQCKKYKHVIHSLLPVLGRILIVDLPIVFVSISSCSWDFPFWVETHFAIMKEMEEITKDIYVITCFLLNNISVSLVLSFDVLLQYFRRFFIKILRSFSNFTIRLQYQHTYKQKIKL